LESNKSFQIIPNQLTIKAIWAIKNSAFSPLPIPVFILRALYLYPTPVADPVVGNPATATPREFFFHFSSAEMKKKGYPVSNMLQKLFFDHDRHPLTHFLNPPLPDSRIVVL
jgi:hypothetical protein